MIRFCNIITADLCEKLNPKKSLNSSHKSWNPLNKRLPRLFLLLCYYFATNSNYSFSIVFSWLSLTLIARNPDDCWISSIWSFFVASGWFSLMRYLMVLTQVQTEVGLLHLSHCLESEALHMWYLLLQAEGYQMVVQVLANLSPVMIPDYAQAPAVYVETDESMC